MTPDPRPMFEAMREVALKHAPVLPPNWHYAATVGYTECRIGERLIGYRVSVELNPSQWKEKS